MTKQEKLFKQILSIVCKCKCCPVSSAEVLFHLSMMLAVEYGNMSVKEYKKTVIETIKFIDKETRKK